jgi:transcriptional regulator with XRE-family HTH domain
VPARSRNAIGPRIRELRIERGLTLDDLARAANISASHLSRLERGQTAPSFTVAAAIARQIGVLPSDLVNIQREQSNVDEALVAALQDIGINEELAQHICDAISTRARMELLTALRTNFGVVRSADLEGASLAEP